MTTDIKELVHWLRMPGHNQTATEQQNRAADALEAMAGEVERLKRMLSPYAEDKEISGMSWNGFYLIGNRKSIDEFKRLENRAAQLEVYRAEFVRRNEAAEAERDRLKAALSSIKEFPRYLGGPVLSKVDDAFQRGLIASHETCADIARKALGDGS